MTAERYTAQTIRGDLGVIASAEAGLTGTLFEQTKTAVLYSTYWVIFVSPKTVPHFVYLLYKPTAISLQGRFTRLWFRENNRCILLKS